MFKETVITLTWPELQFAATVGVARQIYAWEHKLNDRDGQNSKRDGWQNHVVGAISEMAVAKELGLYWCGTVGRVNLPDVGSIEVRAITAPDHRLIIKERDRDEAVFYLVYVNREKCVFKGAILGADAKRPEFWTDPGTGRPAYFVAQSVLNDESFDSAKPSEI